VLKAAALKKAADSEGYACPIGHEIPKRQQRRIAHGRHCLELSRRLYAPTSVIPIPTQDGKSR